MRISKDDSLLLTAAKRCLWIIVCLSSVFLVIRPATLWAASFSGTVFEDINYGGGAGRNWATASANGGSACPNARVELFDNTGAFVTATITDAAGNYSFGPTLVANRNYIVRVVSSSITSSRTGYVAGLLPVLTYRTDASTSTAVDVTNYVGGQDPTMADAGNAATGWILDAVTGVFSGSGSGKAHAFATVRTSGTPITGVNFGWNFNTIVNRNNSGQGSLRQFILNSNALGNTGLAIQGQPAGQDVSLFMISDGLAHPGLRAGLTNLLNASGVAVITPATLLPAVTDANTTIDGTTQTANVGNTNTVVLGTGGTVGVDGLALSMVPGPEVEIAGSGTLATGLLIQANNAVVRGLSIYGFGSVVGDAAVRVDAFTGALIEANVLGARANSFTDPGAAQRNQAGVSSAGGSNGTVRNNLIGFGRVCGVRLDTGSTGWLVSNNEIRDSGMDTGDGDGITINAAATNIATGNLITGSSSQGVAVTVAGATGNQFINNTVTGNGVGIASSLVQSPGIVLRNGAALTTLDRNIIRANYGAGVQANNGSTGTRITRNSFALNGTITARNGSGPTGQIAIDLNSPTDNIEFGTSPFYTLNDLNDADTGGNGLLNFPVLVSATSVGGNLVVTGYARPGSLIELYIANPDPSGFGEGETYLLTLTEGGTGAGGTDPFVDTDAGTGTYGPGAINGIVQGTDTTNKFMFTFPMPGGVSAGTRLTATATLSGQTSEFSGLVTVGVSISGMVFEDLNYGGGAGRDETSSSGAGRSGARVELYNSAGAYVTSTATDAAGNYFFPGLPAGIYTVRVVNATVTSSRTGYVAGLLPVQTYRTNASSGAAVAVTDYVGGQNPSVADAGNGSPGATMNTTTGVFTAGASGTAQSITSVALGASSISGVDFGFNFDTVVNVNNAGQGSLRQFITNANTLGGDASLAQSGLVAAKENAVFMISNGTAAAGLRTANNYFASGLASIAPTSALPTISAPLVLDAQKQPGWTGAPIVELNGTGAGAGANGLTLNLNASGSAIRGLIINRFTGNGIDLNNASNNTIAGNYIGTDSSGTADRGNGSLALFTSGILLENGSSGNTIGGTTAADRNVISGNEYSGIAISAIGTSNNIVIGNYIGTAVDGVTLLGNTRWGVIVWNGASNNRIGGTASGEGNVIAGAGQMAGVGVDNNTANTTHIAVLGNSIFSNYTIGIDLNVDGVSVNNGTKNAGLPNYDMDYPVFTSAALNGAILAVDGYVGSAANQATFANSRVEVFKSDDDATGYGEGKTYLGFLTSDASGNFSGTLDVTGKGLNPGDKITGTATDGLNNTSEFGPNVPVSPLSLAIVKQAWELNGSAPLSSPVNAPAGAPLVFLIYVKNTSAIQVTDIRINDLLDQTGFDYVAGSMVRTSAGSPPADTATDKQIFDATAPGTGTALSDGMDADVGSALDTGAPAGVDRITIGAVTGQANGVLNINAHTTFALRFEVKIK
jgi:hypothetical protein